MKHNIFLHFKTIFSKIYRKISPTQTVTIQLQNNYYKTLEELPKEKNYYDLDKNAKDTKSCLNPWAFIRVKNEEKTLKASLNSITQAVQRGIIVYQECDDRSIEIINDFCRKNKGFWAIKYEKNIENMSDYLKDNYQEYKRKNNLSELYEYYNFTLNFIPKDEWLIKIDVDQVYNAKKLFESFYIAKKHGDKTVVFYTRLNIYLKNKKPYLLKNSLINQQDHWLVRNTDLKFQEFYHDNRKMEILNLPLRYKGFIAQNSSLHFPFVKTSREQCNNDINKKDLLTPKEYEKYMQKDIIDKSMVNEEYINSFINLFEL